jgi:UDP-N-acetylmuramate--alanine ligase
VQGRTVTTTTTRAPIELEAHARVEASDPPCHAQGEPTSLGMNPFLKRIFMVGIGGCGMAGLARMLKSRGGLVAGVDRESSQATQDLCDEAIDVGFDQSARALPARCDLLVVSAAVAQDHPMVLAARSRGIPVMLYAAAVGACMQGRTGAAIAGTHGKSTTTAMLGCALTDAGLDPTVIVGATTPQLAHGVLGEVSGGASIGFRLGSATIPTGAMAGTPGLLVVEACEFNRSFHNFRPQVASISGIEADHLDCYGTLDAVVESFHHFAKLLPPASLGGKLLIAHDGAHRREVTAGLACEVRTIGYSPEADYVVSFDPVTRAVGLSHEGGTLARWTNLIPGSHMAFNACVAMTLATWLGADAVRVARSLAQFRGVDRRMQLVGEKPVVGGGVVRVFDDYGHHPTEIDATLRALRESERPHERGGRLICVFQPHQHSRTRHLLEEFAMSFSQADMVIVPEIYFVRDSEEERHLVTSRDLVDRLRARGVQAEHLDPFDAIVSRLEETCRAEDLVVVMGAGPVWQVAREFVGIGK